MIDKRDDKPFKLKSKYKPSGDQPQAIESLVDNIEGGEKAQILLGATGTGKTYTMSQVISKVNKPTLVIAHNKTLAGQLYGEFKEFFQTMLWNTLFPIMTTTNLKHMSHQATPISKKIVQSMMKSINFAIQPPLLYLSVTMS